MYKHDAKYIAAQFSSIPAFVNWINRDRPLIFTYHGIYDGPRKKDLFPATFVHVDDMVLQLREIKKRYHIITPDDLLESLESKTPLPSHSALVTFDDGYESFSRLAEPLLQSLGIQTIVFVATLYVEKQVPFWYDLVWYFIKQQNAAHFHWLAEVLRVEEIDSSRLNPMHFLNKMKEMLPEQRDAIVDQINILLAKHVTSSSVLKFFYSLTGDQIKKLAINGTTFGGHTHSHTILSAMPISLVEKEILENKRKLEKMSGQGIHFFAYPNGGKGDFQEVHKSLLLETGYKAAFSLTQQRSMQYYDSMAISRINVVPEDTKNSFLFRCSGILPLINKLKKRFA